MKGIPKFLSALFLGAATISPSLHAAESRPNVLFLVSDDLRPELGCYGNTDIKSPHIDRLASRGLVFNRAYCQQAVCSPSRSSLLTGLRPDTTKVWDLNTHFRKALPDAITLPRWFKNNGYATMGMGKIYHGKFDDPADWSVQAPDVPRNPRQGKSAKPASAEREQSKSEAGIPLTKTDRGAAFAMTEDSPDGGGDGNTADKAVRALRKFKEGTQPFFLAVGFSKPHLPFSVPKTYWDLYQPDQIPMATNRFLPKGAPDFALVPQNELWSYSGVPDTPSLPDDYARQLKHGYYAAVSYMDAQLGRVLAELDTLGLTEDTIIILWGDHGWKLGEHNRWSKHSNVEDDARSPLIVAAPGMKAAGQQSDSLVEFIDIYPTLADLAGLPAPTEVEGKSFKALLDDPAQSFKKAAFSQYPRTVEGRRIMGYSMRTDRYRFTRWLSREDPGKVEALELYDHHSDPQENTNIAHDPANQPLVEELTRQFKAALPVAPTHTAKQKP